MKYSKILKFLMTTQAFGEYPTLCVVGNCMLVCNVIGIVESFANSPDRQMF